MGPTADASQASLRTKHTLPSLQTPYSDHTSCINLDILPIDELLQLFTTVHSSFHSIFAFPSFHPAFLLLFDPMSMICLAPRSAPRSPSRNDLFFYTASRLSNPLFTSVSFSSIFSPSARLLSFFQTLPLVQAFHSLRPILPSIQLGTLPLFDPYALLFVIVFLFRCYVSRSSSASSFELLNTSDDFTSDAASTIGGYESHFNPKG